MDIKGIKKGANQSNKSEKFRCVCGSTDENEFLIRCDHCHVWQHAPCVGITTNNVPIHYYCESCTIAANFNLIESPGLICMCGNRNDDGQLIQCQECHTYQHFRCIPNNADLNYICFRCKSKTINPAQQKVSSSRKRPLITQPDFPAEPLPSKAKLSDSPAGPAIGQNNEMLISQLRQVGAHQPVYDDVNDSRVWAHGYESRTMGSQNMKRTNLQSIGSQCDPAMLLDTGTQCDAKSIADAGVQCNPTMMQTVGVQVTISTEIGIECNSNLDGATQYNENGTQTQMLSTDRPDTCASDNANILSTGNVSSCDNDLILYNFKNDRSVRKTNLWTPLNPILMMFRMLGQGKHSLSVVRKVIDLTGKFLEMLGKSVWSVTVRNFRKTITMNDLEAIVISEAKYSFINVRDERIDFRNRVRQGAVIKGAGGRIMGSIKCQKSQSTQFHGSQELIHKTVAVNKFKTTLPTSARIAKDVQRLVKFAASDFVLRLREEALCSAKARENKTIDFIDLENSLKQLKFEDLCLLNEENDE